MNILTLMNHYFVDIRSQAFLMRLMKARDLRALQRAPGISSMQSRGVGSGGFCPGKPKPNLDRSPYENATQGRGKS